jgi:hypothetical protein
MISAGLWEYHHLTGKGTQGCVDRSLGSTAVGKASRAIAIRLGAIDLHEMRSPLVGGTMSAGQFGSDTEKTNGQRDDSHRTYDRHP